MTVEILECGPLTSIQDRGRRGYQRFGVPPSGPMDKYAFSTANQLVGNPADAAGLETSLMPVRLRFWQDGLTAICGRGYELYLNGQKRPSWTALWVHQGDELLMQPVSFGWMEIAFSGGIIVPEVLGSKATNQRAALGGVHGKNLQSGERLVLGSMQSDPVLMAGTGLVESLIPAYSDNVEVGLIPGPHLDHFREDALAQLFNSEYKIGMDSDRMGYRLNGEALPMKKAADILSEGMVMGAVQVPASGQPMVMLADRPATGGYARIGTIISVDMPLLVQATPGQGRVRFYEIDVATAQEKYRQQMKALETTIHVSRSMSLANIMGAHD